MPTNSAFLDSSFAIALLNKGDQHHDQARGLLIRMKADGTRVFTRTAVILEIANALSRLRFRKAVIELVDSLTTDANVEMVPLTDELYRRAWMLYRERTDKEWALTDTISILVMRERGLTDALTADAHFNQAGFRALLRED